MTRKPARLFTFSLSTSLRSLQSPKRKRGSRRPCCSCLRTFLARTGSSTVVCMVGQSPRRSPDQDGDPGNFEPDDIITFRNRPARRRPRRCGSTVRRPRSRIGRTIMPSALLRVLFPAGLASSVLGRSAGELHGQQILLTTALETEDVRRTSPGNRVGVGGLVEFETLHRDGRRAGDSVWAWQGLYA